MIRTALLIFMLLLLYQAFRTVIRSAVDAYHRDDPRPQVSGEEMVLDPNCRTYVLKGRAYARRVHGAQAYFCCAACADEYERRQLP